jgi:hypothetical protein
VAFVQEVTTEEDRAAGFIKMRRQLVMHAELIELLLYLVRAFNVIEDDVFAIGTCGVDLETASMVDDAVEERLSDHHIRDLLVVGGSSWKATLYG